MTEPVAAYYLGQGMGIIATVVFFIRRKHRAIPSEVRDVESRALFTDPGYEWVRMVEAPKAEGPTAQPSPLTWTKEKPKVEGWYWLARDKYPQYVFPVRVTVLKHDNGCEIFVEESTEPEVENVCVDGIAGQWIGPLPEPTPPEGGSQ